MSVHDCAAFRCDVANNHHVDHTGMPLASNPKPEKIELRPSEHDAKKAMSRLRAVRRLAQYALQITDVGDLHTDVAIDRLAAIPLDDYTTVGEAMATNLKRLHEHATESRALRQEGI